MEASASAQEKNGHQPDAGIGAARGVVFRGIFSFAAKGCMFPVGVEKRRGWLRSSKEHEDITEVSMDTHMCESELSLTMSITKEHKFPSPKPQSK